MEIDDWIPDIVVGVDFGMTCTGVAYSFAPAWPSPKAIQHWPGKLFSELANKVPTQIAYRHASGSDAQSWGFQCEHEDSGLDVKEYFKLHLYPHHLDDQPDAPSREEALVWFRDYTRCIYQHVISYFASIFPNFGSRRVEFIYSVPTTWKDPRMSAEIVQYMQIDSPNHRVVIGLTEAEAAAVYACKQHYEKDDVILICDAGGGTTDVNVLRVISPVGEPTRLEPLDYVEGKPIGSVFIDKSVHQLVSQKLEKIRQFLPAPPRVIAWRMLSGRFERFKCSFGTDTTWKIPALKLDVPYLNPGSDYPDAGIYNSQISISRQELQRFFDVKLTEMYSLLDEQIARVQRMHPLKRISYLVLSGGFGSSPYVRRGLLERYGNEGAVHGIEGMQILIADEPQLAVVEGLVMDRAQQLKQGVVTLGSRLCRVSYGIICDKMYEPHKHLGEPVRYDERDKTTYALNQIDWLIVQGNPIPQAGVSKQFQKKLEPMELDRPWKVKFVMSTLPADQLPRSMFHGGVRTICEVDIFMDAVDKKQKNHRWYNFKPAYWIIKVIVKVVVGPADLQFQLWTKDGRRIKSSKHEPIRVKWEPIVQEMEG
ncbi:hypothetical protein MGYG_05010 [Nannizzia gypsea CBS 118893]|uniref:Hsp70-like protein n=1 Tax=Arthroderma gypseum (strain ATCC MYA-4604 / CBS 118893) TaxID=535722 RepID=E4UY14_ARTGP|nr:hypothetical protein MGYG_05010 [Nannizzia gypsea CBS 118893]EFR02007.1 hypothetical protein MGYG_05010 [Nannizzia gypsea CBS 118893]